MGERVGKIIRTSRERLLERVSDVTEGMETIVLEKDLDGEVKHMMDSFTQGSTKRERSRSLSKMSAK